MEAERERQALLIELGDALRNEATADGVAECALRLLLERLRLDRCYVGVYRMEEDRAEFPHQLARPGLPALPAGLRLSSFPEAFKVALDGTLVVHDVARDMDLSELDRSSMAGLGFGALVAATLRKGAGRPLWAIVAVSMQARRWTAGEITLIEEVTERTWAAMERARAAEALRASEAQLRAAFDIETVGVVFFDLGGGIRYANDAFLALVGHTREELEAGEDRNRHHASAPWRWHDEQTIAALEATGSAGPFEKEYTRADGSRIWILCNSTMLDERTAVEFVIDVTARTRADIALRESEERLRRAAEISRFALWDWHLRTGEVAWSDEHYTMQGYAVGEVTPSYEAWAARVHPEDRPATEAAIIEARDTAGEFVREFRSLHPDGSVHWLSARGRFFYDEAGEPVRMVGAMLDVTERREWEERQKVLVAELQHRAFNLMGVVRSTADAAIRRSGGLEEFKARFNDRIAVLARVQRLLSKLHEDQRVTFDELVRGELESVGALDVPGRVSLDGPADVPLRSSGVQTFAMALHELATNAVKYGALSQPGTHLDVRWRVQSNDAGAPWLHVDWRESGVRMPDCTRPQGTGQGRELIEKALPYQLSAKTDYRMTPDGVHCSIALPISGRRLGTDGRPSP